MISALITLVAAALLVVIDQGIKLWATASLAPVGSMPLIPGVSFTNAIRDIADGDYISGSVRMLDALLIFFCIAIGVGMAYSLLRGIVGGDLL